MRIHTTRTLTMRIHTTHIHRTPATDGAHASYACGSAVCASSIRSIRTEYTHTEYTHRMSSDTRIHTIVRLRPMALMHRTPAGAPCAHRAPRCTCIVCAHTVDMHRIYIHIYVYIYNFISFIYMEGHGHASRICTEHRVSYVCGHTHTYAYTRMRIHTHTFADTRIHTLYMHTHTYAYICGHTHTYAYIRIRIHTHTFADTRIHTHTHTSCVVCMRMLRAHTRRSMSACDTRCSVHARGTGIDGAFLQKV
jgi:hypothetical protein